MSDSIEDGEAEPALGVRVVEAVATDVVSGFHHGGNPDPVGGEAVGRRGLPLQFGSQGHGPSSTDLGEEVGVLTARDDLRRRDGGEVAKRLTPIGGHGVDLDLQHADAVNTVNERQPHLQAVVVIDPLDDLGGHKRSASDGSIDRLRLVLLSGSQVHQGPLLVISEPDT